MEDKNKYRTMENHNSMVSPERGTTYTEMIMSLYETLPDIFQHFVDDRNIVQEILDESASGLQSEWDLTNTPVNKESLIVFVSGVNQSNFDLTGQTLSFSSNLPVGSKLFVWYIKES